MLKILLKFIRIRVYFDQYDLRASTLFVISTKDFRLVTCLPATCFFPNYYPLLSLRSSSIYPVILPLSLSILYVLPWFSTMIFVGLRERPVRNRYCFYTFHFPLRWELPPSFGGPIMPS